MYVSPPLPHDALWMWLATLRAWVLPSISVSHNLERFCERQQIAISSKKAVRCAHVIFSAVTEFCCDLPYPSTFASFDRGWPCMRFGLQSQITASARRRTQHEEGGAHNIRRRETQPQAGQCRRRRRWLSYSAPASARGADTVGGVRCSLVPLAGICYCAAADGASQAAQTISSKKQECKDSLRDKNARVAGPHALTLTLREHSALHWPEPGLDRMTGWPTLSLWMALLLNCESTPSSSLLPEISPLL
eukprot:COSAG01_NODE_89_length_27311_cov_22.687061_20_plen_248_part_00